MGAPEFPQNRWFLNHILCVFGRKLKKTEFFNMLKFMGGIVVPRYD